MEVTLRQYDRMSEAERRLVTMVKVDTKHEDRLQRVDPERGDSEEWTGEAEYLGLHPGKRS